MSQKLTKHKAIGWDVDKTLINGLWSNHWRAYVTANVDNHDHWIITFRNDADAATVFDEIEEQYNYPLKREWFKGIINLPRDIDNAYNSLHPELLNFDYNKEPTGKILRISKNENISLEDARLIKESLHDWKAKVCFDLGCTVLVDDLESIVAEGCEKYGVEFIHSIKEKYRN